jgi:hypothetical protein
MKDRFRLFRRGWGTYYVEEQQTLQTSDKSEAKRMVHARNEAQHTPQVNLMIAKAYLAASDPALTSRTWQDVLNAITCTKTGDTRISQTGLAEAWGLSLNGGSQSVRLFSRNLSANLRFLFPPCSSSNSSG